MLAVKHLVKFATVLMCSCGSSSQMVCRRLSTLHRLSLQLEFIVLFQHGVPDVIVQLQRVQICKAWRRIILLSKAVRFQPVLHDARTLKNKGCLVVG